MIVSGWYDVFCTIYTKSTRKSARLTDQRGGYAWWRSLSQGPVKITVCGLWRYADRCRTFLKADLEAVRYTPAAGTCRPAYRRVVSRTVPLSQSYWFAVWRHRWCVKQQVASPAGKHDNDRNRDSTKSSLQVTKIVSRVKSQRSSHVTFKSFKL